MLLFYLKGLKSHTQRKCDVVLRAPFPNHIAYAGTRLEQFINPNLYWGIEGAGAASGGVAGYAEFLSTFGIEKKIFTNTTIGSRVSLGMGGGGGVVITALNLCVGEGRCALPCVWVRQWDLLMAMLALAGWMHRVCADLAGCYENPVRYPVRLH